MCVYIVLGWVGCKARHGQEEYTSFNTTEYEMVFGHATEVVMWYMCCSIHAVAVYAFSQDAMSLCGHVLGCLLSCQDTRRLCVR
jgi:hypothetical protein